VKPRHPDILLKPFPLSQASSQRPLLGEVHQWHCRGDLCFTFASPVLGLPVVIAEAVHTDLVIEGRAGDIFELD
jgi:hypothetical protein